MITLTKQVNKKAELINIKMPKAKAGEVLIKVRTVALCRTDLFVANETIKRDFDVVLGHEFSGDVVEDFSNTFTQDQVVVVNPLFSNKKFMGLDFDGALAEYISVPLNQVYDATGLDYRMAAYTEPVAASMAVLDANISSEQKGAVYGSNRIAQLTFDILISKGFDVVLLDEKLNYEDNTFDFIVETIFEEQHITKMMNILKEDGILVIKSRKKVKVGIDASLMISKGITMQAVNYYNFSEAINWIKDNQSIMLPLIGETFSIQNWENAFEAAMISETKKIFISFN